MDSPIVGFVLSLVKLCKTFFGIFIIYSAAKLYEDGYVNTGLVEVTNTLVTESPESITFLLLVLVGIKFIRM